MRDCVIVFFLAHHMLHSRDCVITFLILCDCMSHVGRSFMNSKIQRPTWEKIYYRNCLSRNNFCQLMNITECIIELFQNKAVTIYWFFSRVPFCISQS
jgi:hypothetical protein